MSGFYVECPRCKRKGAREKAMLEIHEAAKQGNMVK
jgi:hypothetical protein